MSFEENYTCFPCITSPKQEVYAYKEHKLVTHNKLATKTLSSVKRWVQQVKNGTPMRRLSLFAYLFASNYRNRSVNPYFRIRADSNRLTTNTTETTASGMLL